MQYTFSEIIGKTPFIRFTVPLLLGIFWGEYGLQTSFNAIWLTIAFGFTYLLLCFYRRFVSYSNRWIWGAVSFLFLLFGGVSLWQQQKRTSELPLEQPILLEAVIIEHPVQKPKAVQLRLQVNAYNRDDSWVKANENIVVYMQSGNEGQVLRAGQRIVFSATLQPIKRPMNPEEFDYRSYMQRRGYYTTAFIRSDAFRIVEENVLPFYKSIPLKMQQALLNTFKGISIGGQELAVLMALTIGDKQLLDDDVKDGYSSAGVIHILAVSGLHVGLLYMLLTYILFFLNGKRYKIMLKTVIILFCLWLYAAIADFSPSVVRATIMFSFVLLAQLSDRRVSTLNAVFASAFFICLLKPLSLFEVGFQLSYLAVISILVFYSKLSRLPALKNPVLKGAWNICCVSFAAQLAVLPLSVFYFHQIPVYFLLANVLVLPLVTVATYLMALLLPVSFIPLLSTAIGYLLGCCIWLITYIVMAVQQLPSAMWGGIYLSPLQLTLSLTALACIMLFVAFRKKYSLWLSAACLALTFSLSIAHYFETSKQNQLVVFNVSNASYIAFVDGHNAVCIKDDRSIGNSFEYNTGGYFIRQRVGKSNIQSVSYSSPDSISFSGSLHYHKGFFWFKGLSVILLNAAEELRLFKDAFPVDILIVTNAFKANVKEVFSHYRPKLVVIDSSVSLRKTKEWITVLEEAEIPYYNVKESGAFVLAMY